MPLSSGARLGPYQIEAAIGAGGMGEVYRARDTRLDRTVAIKVLPSEVSADPDRRVRFEREARAVAALSHPHICMLFDIGEAVLPNPEPVAAEQRDGRIPSPESRIPARVPVHYLVMEYLAGESLAERLLRGPVPLAQALDIGAQIAEALAAAHKHGIIHRDLKPGNVMLTAGSAGRSGVTTAKLLDFGLAKLTAHGERPALESQTHIPTQAAPVTARGTILGTLQYMAPEQLEGKEADARTDLWALGAILYEMVTGRRAFEGASQVSLIGNIMNAEPAALATLQPLTPPAFGRIVTKCLAKHPDDRWAGAHDVADELRWIADELSVGRKASGGMPAPATIATAAGGRRRMRRYGLAALTAVVMAALAATAWWWRVGERPALPPPRLVHLTSSPGSERFPALSPDGKQVAFQWNGEDGRNWDIYVKLIGETNALRLTTDALPDSEPCWSPDGRRIAFKRRGADGTYAVLTMSPLGGTEQKLAALPALLDGLSWSPDGKWLAVARGRTSAADKDDSDGICLVPAPGGDPVRVTSPPSPLLDFSPKFSPDGGSLAFVRSMGDAAGEVFIQPLARDGAVTGDPRQITHSGVLTSHLAWHPDGRSVVYVGQPAFLLSYLYRVPIGVDAPPERIELAGSSAYAPSASPGINRLVFQRSSADYDVWRLQPGGVAVPVIRSSFSDWGPQLSPDGRRVAFTSNRNGESSELWTANADGTAPTQLTRGPGRNQGSATWSPDGRWIAFDSQGADGTFDIYVIESSGGQARRITSEPSNEVIPTWSRDGQWVYYRSDRTGRREVWRAPSSGGKWEQVTSTGAQLAFESTDGKTLFCVRATGELFAMPVGGGPELRLIDFVASGARIAVVPAGIYYWGRTGTDGLTPLLFFDLSSRRSAELTRVAGAGMGLTASPDRKSVLFVRSVDSGNDLMLIENFR
jgi:Tol biopolymer transport system component